MSLKPDRTLHNPRQVIGDLRQELGRTRAERDEVQAQQTAATEVLQVINSSRGDLAPVFEALLSKALQLCKASFGVLWTYDGGLSSAAAIRGATTAYREFLRVPHRPGPGSAQLRLIQGAPFVHVEDLANSLDYRSGDTLPRALVDLGGGRTLLACPLRKDGVYRGAVMIYRQEVHGFSDGEVSILQNFAAQAVIAMENARLITEMREALEQQTATADVLKVISRSTFDLQAVLQTVVSAAHRLCQSDYSVIFRKEGDVFRWAAGHGISGEYEERERRAVIQPGTDTVIGRAVLASHAVQIADAKTDPLYHGQAESDARAMLGVPLLRDGVAIGGIGLARNRVEPFTNKQVELVTTFADQAVIAMENARLISETREALEHQSATAEVLGVINSSPGDLSLVFDAMLDRALELCGAAFGVLWTYDGKQVHATALRGVPPAFAEFLTRTPHPVGRENAHGRLLAGESLVHIADVADDEAYRSGDPVRRTLVEVGGGRTLLAVPLRKDDTFLGDFVIYRQEVRPFFDKQIDLLQNFAAQAVIAIENARLLNEIRQRQKELRVTFDNMVDGVAMFDEGMHLAAWNRNFQKLLDLPNELLTDRPYFDAYIRYLTEHGEFGETTPEDEIARLRARLLDHYSFERIRPDGTVIEVRHNPMPDGGIVLIYSDITERKRSEAEIRAARDAAEVAYAELKAAQASLIQAEKMASLGQLTAGIAHEIKNPLNFVNNFASLSTELLGELKEEVGPVLAAFDNDKREAIDETIELLTGNLDKIVEHGQRADNIVKSMLEHSRGVSGERHAVDLNTLIDEALNLAYHGARAQDTSFEITLEHDYAPSLRPIEVAPQELTRVLLNLFSNGFYATHKRIGGVAFRPVLKVTTADIGEAVEVKVRDNGTGIPPEIKDKLFQPFFTTKPTGEGTGLGLSISYDIITQQHGGTITVESEPGVYTEFTIRLPK